MWQIWLIISGICLIIEIITTGFLVFWFSIGALIAMVVSIFIDNIIIQTAVFIISSTILIFATKPFVKKFVHIENSIKTNAFSLVGKNAIVTQDINSINGTGQVKVNGEIWSAIGLDDVNISQNTEVKINDIKGVKLIVSPIKK